jgi:hypothetical protein
MGAVGTRIPAKTFDLQDATSTLRFPRKEVTMIAATKGGAYCLALLALGSAGAIAGACTGEIEHVTKQLAATDAGSGPTKGTSGPTAGDQKGQHPGTSLMSKETEGKAISPGDVRSQSGIKAEASKTLARARELDAKGDEAACRDAVKTAKTQAGL